MSIDRAVLAIAGTLILIPDLPSLLALARGCCRRQFVSIGCVGRAGI
jgi:hypothetical protein